MRHSQSTPEARQRVAAEFSDLREPIAQLTQKLLRALEISGDNSKQLINVDLAEFHRAVPHGLDLDSHEQLSRPDFLVAVPPAQMLYRAGLFVEAVTYSQKVGSDGHYISKMPEDERHRVTAQVLNNWYVGYHQQNIWDVASAEVENAALARMGLADPMVKVIDGILTGKPEHAVYTDLDDVQRNHLREWKGKLVPKTIGDQQSALLRNDPMHWWDEFVMRELGEKS